MNRKDRQTADAHLRTNGTVSPMLLQEQVKRLAAEGHQMRTVLCAIVKELGRVRVSRATVEGLNENDAIEEREVGGDYFFEYKRSDMVTPHGVTNGKGNEPNGAA